MPSLVNSNSKSYLLATVLKLVCWHWQYQDTNRLVHDHRSNKQQLLQSWGGVHQARGRCRRVCVRQATPMRLGDVRIKLKN
jgi:hypothetical protein